MKTLKRPGSPNLSESSGNESARKKAKKAKTASARQSRSSTPVPGSQSQTAGQRRKMGAGSTSDGEATGGEMSDGQPRKKKIKLVPSGGRGTPTGSRPGSPLPGPTAGENKLPRLRPNLHAAANHHLLGILASPSASPTKVIQASSKPAIAAEEIIAALPPPPGGLGISAFLKIFNDRVGDGPGKMTKPDLIALIRQNCQYGTDKLLRRKS
jgi:transcription initiation factor TFIIF subunit alpha